MLLMNFNIFPLIRWTVICDLVLFFGFVVDGIVDVVVNSLFGVVVHIDSGIGFNAVVYVIGDNVIAAVQQLCPNIRAGGGGALQW